MAKQTFFFEVRTVTLKTELRELGTINKTGTSQVGAISKAQKAQNIFFGEKLEIFEKIFLSEKVAQCRKM